MSGGQIVEAPLAHYIELYEKSDVGKIAARTGLDFDVDEGRFSLMLVGKQYYVKHPRFSISGEISGETGPYEDILILRYLLEGMYAPPGSGIGGMLSYEEMPWGKVYGSQFRGRVLGRIAREFGRDPSLLTAAVEAIPGLFYQAVGGADAAYRIEFLNGLFVSVLVWAGDEEFPASAQMLFSDNFKYAFNAEDMAVVGDVVVSRLKGALNEKA